MSKYIVARANLLVFGVYILMAALIGFATWESFNATRSARSWSAHTYQVLGVISELDLAFRLAETRESGYLETGNEAYLPPFRQAIDRVNLLLDSLRQLTSDNPVQQQRIGSLAQLLQGKLTESARTVQIRHDQGLTAALAAPRVRAGAQIETLLTAMTKTEQGLLVEREAEADSRGNWVRGLVAGGTLITVLILLWAARLLNRAWLRSTKAEAEQRSLALKLKGSLDSLSQGVGVFGADPDGSWRLVNWNDCFQTLLALPPELAHADAPYTGFVTHAADGGFGTLEREDQIQHSRNSIDEPVTYEVTGSRGHLLEVRRTPMPDGGFVLTLSDMTRRAQAEAVLRESQKMQAVGQLTGGIAHDFNNLLTVILGNLEFTRNKLPTDSPLQVRIDRAAWAAQRGASLTAQLLAFARKQPLAPKPIDLTETVPELVPLLRRTLGEHIDVRYVETAGLWPAMADAAQLESALLNLALNARDAMPGGGRLTIELANKVLDADYARAHAEVHAGDYAMLAVSDTGHGMTPDVVARVFEPFFTTKPDGRGTGLGLAMVFGFVKQSGGHIKIYSEPGEGTVVRIYLPRASAAAVPAPQRPGKPIDLPQGSATILVVEDEPAVREIAVAILRDLGYLVFEATDGEEGLRVFGAHAPDIDLLLTDVVLPGKVRGREMAERITSIRPEIKVLFMSGYTENSIVHQGRLDDGVNLIGKPFHREQLARKVAEVLGPQGDNVVELKPRGSGQA